MLYKARKIIISIILVFIHISKAQTFTHHKKIPVANLFEIGFLNEQQNPSDYLEEEVFISPSSQTEGLSIIYGNKTFGYFQSKHLSIKNKSISFRFYPPYYGEEIHFYLKTEKGLKRLSKKIYKEKNQLFKMLFNFKVITGKLRSRFFTLPIRFTIDDKPKHHFFWGVFILNRRGQIVWGNYEPRFPYTYIERLDPDHYFIKGMYNDVLMSPRGTKKFIYSIPFSHHDCEKLKTKMVCLSEVKRFIRTSFFKKSRKVTGFNLVEIDLNTKVQRELWNVFDNGHEILELAKTHYKNSPEVDWFHANSLQFQDNNIIISLRNLNRIIKINYDSKKIEQIWGDNLFFGQHHARIIDQNLYVFDNGVNKSSLKKFSINDRNLSPSWSFSPSPVIHSEHHGSFYKKHDRIFCYFLNEDDFKHHFFEIDERTGKEYSHVMIWPTKLVTNIQENKYSFYIYRSQPLDHLDHEVFIGDKIDYTL